MTSRTLEQRPNWPPQTPLEHEAYRIALRYKCTYRDAYEGLKAGCIEVDFIHARLACIRPEEFRDARRKAEK